MAKKTNKEKKTTTKTKNGFKPIMINGVKCYSEAEVQAQLKKVLIDR